MCVLPNAYGQQLARTRNDDGRAGGRKNGAPSLPAIRPVAEEGTGNGCPDSPPSVRQAQRPPSCWPRQRPPGNPIRPVARGIINTDHRAPSAPLRAQHQGGRATEPTPARASSHCACYMTPPSVRHGARKRAPPASLCTQEKRKHMYTPSVVVGRPPDDQTRPAGEAARARAVRPSGRPDA